MSASAGVIRHGRRSGQARRGEREGGHVSPEQLTSGMILPDGTDLRQVTVLSKKDWQRIGDQLSKSNREEQRLRAQREEKEDLHARSKDMVKNWSNTIVGQRLKKLEAHKIRERKEEEEKVQIDIEEEEYQSQKRKAAIDKAKTQQYYQTDRVKSFHGALLLTEVLKEREAQIELKRAKARANAGKDKDIQMRYQRELEMGILEDQEKARFAIEESKKCKGFQLQQINDHLKQKEYAKQDELREAEEMRQNIERYEAEKRRIDDIRQKEREAVMNSHVQTIKNRDLIRAAERQKEEEDDEAIRIFAAAKQKMGQLREDKEQELWQQRQDHTNRMVELLHSQLKQKADDEDDRISNAVRERERIQEKEEREKEENLRATLQSIADHRTSQLRRAEEQARENKRLENENLQLRVEADRIFQAQQAEKMQGRKNEALALQDFHTRQIEEAAASRRREKDDQLEHDQRNLELLRLEEQQFQEYAAKVINHCHKNGRNVYPLVHAAREGHGAGMGPVFEGKGGIRPSYLVQDNTGVELPNYQNDSTADIKDGQNSGDSRKRLGFVW